MDIYGLDPFSRHYLLKHADFVPLCTISPDFLRVFHHKTPHIRQTVASHVLYIDPWYVCAEFRLDNGS